MPEKQTCPRRMNEFGPWDHESGLDSWVADRWTTDEEADRRDIEEYARKYPGSFRGSHLWKWSWGPPRTCDFCGSIHPEDAIRLVSDGWEIDATTKGYKCYLNPPGSATKHEAFMKSMCDYSREPGSGVPSIWSPTPPVKAYSMHFGQIPSPEGDGLRLHEALMEEH